MAHKKQLARDTHNKDPRTVVDGMSVLELLRIVWSHSQSTSQEVGNEAWAKLSESFTSLSASTIHVYISAGLAAVAADSDAECQI